MWKPDSGTTIEVYGIKTSNQAREFEKAMSERQNYTSTDY